MKVFCRGSSRARLQCCPHMHERIVPKNCAQGLGESGVDGDAHAAADGQTWLIGVDLNETFECQRFVGMEEIRCQRSARSVPVRDAFDFTAPSSRSAGSVFNDGRLTWSK